MAVNNYNPQSHFFVEHTKIRVVPNADTVNEATDAFGPVTTNPTGEYRTTSFVQAEENETPKVFAICDGRILIQPMTGDTTKVNLILKPEASYAPIKIKYFIYRGVRKSDLVLNNETLTPVNESDETQPTFLKGLWKTFDQLNIELPTAFPPHLIGYDLSNPATDIIDEVFNQRENDYYQLPPCNAGMHLGYFTGKIGLDIVLDDGDYQLERQEELFKFDLEYARKSEHIFDLSKIPVQIPLLNPTPTQIARYKEYILRFMDAAAFWGSHIDCGVIRLEDNSRLEDSDTIYSTILNKYQTKDVLYIHITEERGRSYAYYDSPDKRKVFFELSNSEQPSNNIQLDYYTASGWPIFLFTGDINNGLYIHGYLEYEISVSVINENKQFIALNVVASTYIQTFSKDKDEISNPNDTISFSYQLPLYDKLCSSFIFINGYLKQEESSLDEYYNYLWPVNIKSNFTLSESENLSYWCTYDKNRLINLDGAPPIGAIIQNKVVFDTGINQLTQTTIKRRLFIASIKASTEKDIGQNFRQNVEMFPACFYYGLTYDNYIHLLYGNNFVINKDSFKDANGNNGNSLTLTNFKDPIKADSFFQLGITESEYNNLITSLPNNANADNVFFYLEKEPDLPNGVKKYELGLQYEDNTGTIVELCPTNKIFVYTRDKFYFFSKDFSAYQHLFFARRSAVFTPKPDYDGEFGFDWMREGETDMPGDTIAYREIMGKLIDLSNHFKVVTDRNVYDGERIVFDRPCTKMFEKLEKEYNPFQVSVGNQTEKYYKPMLMLYPHYDKDNHLEPEPELDKQFRTEFGITKNDYDYDVNRVAELRLKFSIAYGYDEPEEICLQYDETLFEIILKNTAGATRTISQQLLEIMNMILP